MMMLVEIGWRHWQLSVRACRSGYLLGDTPKDIGAAKANQLKSVGLCTGAFTREQLMLEKPDIILDSFEQADVLLAELSA